MLSPLLLFVLMACGGSESQSPSNHDNSDSGGSLLNTDATALSLPGAKRDWLTKEALLADAYPHTSPIHNGYFMPVGDSSAALHEFSGTIILDTRRLLGDFEEFRINGDESFKNFPDVDLSFISHNGALIPTNRDRQVTLSDNSFWGIILDPGTVWSETTDEGWSRASFPFTLISARRNQGHNGVATFLYNDTEISNLRIQVVQETALWFRQDIYAQLLSRYDPHVLANANDLIQDYELEMANSVPIKPWSELTIIGNETQRREFNSSLADDTINQTALIKDGEVYLQGCFTRYGDYPYCRWMRNGAYSITKSLGAGFTLFRLAQKYGLQVFDRKIADYVNVTSNHNGWDNVTFGDVLNMVAGIGDNGAVANSGNIFADENESKMERWIGRDSADEKLGISFSYANYPWEPGEVFRYNSALTFVLAVALDNYYKSIEGEDADVWQMLVEEVYKPIGIQHVPKLRTIEANGHFGVAELFHGLYPNIDDMAKLSALIHNDGVFAGRQLLHRQSLREALFKADKQGFHSWWEDNQYDQSRYLHGFWSSPFGNDAGCVKHVPYMSGYGGNIFAILDNGVSIYRFSDANRYSPADMIRVANNERAICD